MIPTEEEISPEFVGCVLTCLSGGGIDDSRVVFMCLAGCYASTYLRDDRTDEDQEQDQPEDEGDDDQLTQLQQELEKDKQPKKRYANSDFSLEVVEGLGATYAGRLRSEGIETLADLMEARPETVAEAAEVSESQAEEWIQTSRSRR